jgi:hypothetical protein
LCLFPELRAVCELKFIRSSSSSSSSISYFE